MSILAAWLVHPIEYRLWLGILVALGLGATVLAALRLRDARAAGRPPDPMTAFLVTVPKSLGTLALLLAAFAFVLEVDVTAVNLSWLPGEVRDDENWILRIAGILTWGAGIAAAGFLASWVLEAIAAPEREE